MAIKSSDQHFIISSLGSIGMRHLRNLRMLRPDARITALRRPESAAVDCLECDDEVVSINDALALHPTAAILAGPAPSHVPLAHAFAAQGVALLIEKPLSHNFQSLETLAKIADHAAAPIMIGYNLRFSEALSSVRSLLSEETIGDVLAVRAEVGQYLPDWRPGVDYRKSVSANKSLGGGPLLELSHEIDYLYWLFGLPDQIFCSGGRYSALEIDVEDCLDLILNYVEPRRLVTIHLDFIQRPACRSCKFIGTRGTLTWYGLEDRLVIDVADPIPDRREIKVSVADRNAMYVDELSAFLQAVENGSPVPIPLCEGIDVMRIISAASKSFELERTVSLFDPVVSQ